MPESNEADSAFFTDVQTLRERARRSLSDGAVTPNYEGDVSKAIELLQSVVATELVCVLRYRMHAIAVSGIDSDSVSEEFAEHAESEHKQMLMAAERIDRLGGVPNLNPDGLLSRSATEYGSDGNLVEMVRQNLVAERVVIEHYRELIRYFGEKDPTTRIMIEAILADEEEHATDMHDLLVAHEGKPFLDESGGSGIRLSCARAIGADASRRKRERTMSVITSVEALQRLQCASWHASTRWTLRSASWAS